MKPGTPVSQSTRLLDQVRKRIRYMHYSLKTEKDYLYWMRFFICLSATQLGGMRYPYYMGVPWLNNIGRPQQTKRIPSVLTKDEVAGLWAQMDGISALLARLLYGTGMRLMEGMRMRVKDVDFERHAVIVREAKGNKDRVVTLPRSLAPALRLQMLAARAPETTNQPPTFTPNCATHAAPPTPAPNPAPGC